MIQHIMNRNDSVTFVSRILIIIFIMAILPGIAPIVASTANPDIYVNQTGWWRAGGAFNESNPRIQAAIDAATAGETIYVYNGSYIENVNLNKAVTLQGEGADVVNVTAYLTNDHVFNVSADYVNISGFKVTGATGNNKAGIYLGSGVDNNNISDNNASNNSFGIYLVSSSNNTLTYNTANSNTNYGISLYSSSNNNTLTSNTANSNNYYAIYLGDSSNNTLTSNTASSNQIGIYLSSSSNNNTLTRNTANSNTYCGIELYSSSNNTFTNNTASSNTNYGIFLDSSSNNTLTSNTANSQQRGIYLQSSSNNTIYNNYFNNTNNAYDIGYNVWNTTITSGTNIIGGSWLGGNYWSNYAGEDTDGDRLGDTLTPYNTGISNGGDYHPLMTADTTAPSITIISPVNTTYIHTSILLNVTTDQTANVNYSLNGAANLSLYNLTTGGNATITGREGENNITVYARDPAGNLNSSIVNFTVATAPVVTASKTYSDYAQINPMTIDPNINVTDGDINVTGAKVSIGDGYVSSEDYLNYTTINGITGNYSTTTGILTLTGNRSGSDYQAAFRNVTYWNNNTNNPNTTQRNITFAIGNNSLYYPGTRHYYEYVSASLTWTNARTAASARRFYGLQGYIVTITSAEENTFLTEKVSGDAWIGANDSVTEGDWYWVAGPEVGTRFYNGTGLSHTIFGYNNWEQPNEPNNQASPNPPGEDFAYMYSGSGHTPGTWNDYKDDQALMSYFTEYGGMAGDPTLHLTATVIVNVTDIMPPTAPTITVPAEGASLTSAYTWVNGTMSADTTNLTVYVNGSITNDSVSVSGATYRISNVPLGSDGVHEINVSAKDAAGNVNSTNATVIVTVDTTAPYITIIFPVNTSYNNASILLNVTTDQTANVTYSLNGAANISLYNLTTGRNTTITGSEGENNITVYANDSVGNLNYSTVNFTIDTIAPSITIISPVNITYNNISILLNIITNQTTNVTYSLNGAANISLYNLTASGNTTISGTQGVNNITVYANDLAGNMGSETVNFTVIPSITISVNASGGANYTRIQDAINNSTAGDTIQVYSGTYNENVNVTKQLTLQGIGMPVVNASGNGSAITLSANGIILEGFIATGAGSINGDAGIKINSNNNTLSGNTASNNRGYGSSGGPGYGYGIYLNFSRNNTLISNNASLNTGYGGSNSSGNGGYGYGYGIYLNSSSNNNLSDNIVRSNTGYGGNIDTTPLKTGGNGYGSGIYLDSSSNNTFINNTASSNTGYGGNSNAYPQTGGNGYGYGISLSSSSIYNTLNGNNVTSNTGTRGYTSYFYCSGNGYGISLSSSSNYNTLSGNNATSNTGSDNYGYGFSLFDSRNNTVSGNNATLNPYGISLSSSNYNTLTNNTMNSNIYNFILSGYDNSEFNQIDTTNLVDGKPVYFINGVADTIYDSLTNAGTFYCLSCVNVTLKNLNLKNNYNGILFWNTTRSNIQNVSASYNYNGIYLDTSSNNTLSGNNATSNTYGNYLVSSSNNTVSGNNATSNADIGIFLSQSNYNTFNGNNATSNYYGIFLSYSNYNTLSSNNATSNTGYGGSGIFLSSSNYNTLSSNNATSNTGYDGSGISLSSSSNNTLSSNNVTSNTNKGISLDSSNYNTLTNNTMNGNKYNFMLSGNSDPHFNNQIDMTNMVDGKPVYYIKGDSDRVYDSSTNAGTFYCIDCVNVTLKNLDLRKNYYGILFWNTTRSNIQNVNASNNYYGIYLQTPSANNTLSGNNATSNYYGISLSSSNNNTLSSNNATSNYYGSGISLSSSNYNTLSSNNATSNYYGGISLSSSNYNTLSSNNATLNTGYYCSGISLSSSSNYNTLTGNNATSNTGTNCSGISLSSSNYNTLISNNARSNTFGNYLSSSINNTFSGNNATSNTYGIYLFSSSNNNNFSGSNVSNNNRGIYLDSSGSNIICNNIFNNTNNFYFATSNTNTWNTTKTAGTNIVGGSSLGGNFWAYPNGTGFSNTCEDIDSDNICDLNYTISTDNIDYLPLAYPDRIAPAVTINTPSNGSTTNNNTPQLNATFSGETVAYAWYNLNNTGNSTPVTNTNNLTEILSPLLEGTYNVTVYANDSAGNTGSSTVNFTVYIPIDIYVNATGWWRPGGVFNSGGTRIQAAIENAAPGDTIYVYNGTYTENVNVNKAVTLQGEGAGVVTFTNITANSHVISVSADYVNISGFKVTGATGSGKAGIYLGSGADHCNISNNNASNNNYGILLISSNNNNTLTNNTANSNINHGIYVGSSHSNTLTNSTANLNGDAGIYLSESSNNTLTNNNASNNVNGIHMYQSSNNTLTNNTANSNLYGIYMHYSSSNTLTNNTANSNSGNGIYFRFSTSNTFTNNTVSNPNNGIVLEDSSSNNTIYNNYFSNTYNARDNGNNTWNTTKTAGTNIIGGTYLGGNYWSDFAGEDTNGDRLGDTLTPYNSSGNIAYGGDYHPLMTVDTTAPFITIISPENTTYNNTSILLRIDTNQIANVTYSLNGAANISLYNLTTGGNTIITAIEGANNITVHANDSAGNLNSSIVYFIVDTTAPSLSITRVTSPTNVTYQNITGTVSDIGGVGIGTVTVNGIAATNGTGYYYYNLTGLELGNNTITVIATDLAENAAINTTYILVIPEVPAITGYAPSSSISDSTGAARTFNISIDQVVNVTWYLNGTQLFTNTSVTEANYTNSSAGSGTWNVTAIANNTNGTDSQEWTWTVMTDNMPPVITISVPVNNANISIFDRIISGSITDESAITANMYVNSVFTKTWGSKGSFRWPYNFTNGSNTVNISATDAYNNINWTNISVFVLSPVNEASLNLTANQSMNMTANDSAGVDVVLSTGNNTANITVKINANINASHFNVSDIDTEFVALGIARKSLVKFVDINATGDVVNLSGVKITMFYNDSDLDLNGNGIIDAGDIKEDTLNLYWHWGNDTSGNQEWFPLTLGADYSGKLDRNNNSGPIVRSVEKNTTFKYISVSTDHFSIYSIAGASIPAATTTTTTTTSGGGGSVSGGSGVVTAEPYENIAVYEMIERNIEAGKPVTYNFTKNQDIIYEVLVTGKENEYDVSMRIEILKNRSKQAKENAPGLVYRNANIISGTKNIGENVIKFKVNDSWLLENGLDSSNIRLVEWVDNKWIILETGVLFNKDGYTHFSAKSTTLSIYAITGIKKEDMAPAPSATEKTAVIPEAAPLSTEEQIPQPEGKTSLWMWLIPAVLIIAALVYVLKRR